MIPKKIISTSAPEKLQLIIRKKRGKPVNCLEKLKLSKSNFLVFTTHHKDSPSQNFKIIAKTNSIKKISHKIPSPLFYLNFKKSCTFSDNFDLDMTAGIVIEKTKISKKDFKNISKANQLNQLKLNYCPFNENHLFFLSRLKKIQSLSINRSGLTDRGVEIISRFKQLEKLDISNNMVGNGKTWLVWLKKQKNVKKIDMTSLGGITDLSIKNLAKMSNLRKLRVDKTGINQPFCSKLPANSKINDLGLNSGSFDKYCISALPKLEKLTLFKYISSKKIKLLKKYKNLRYLDFSNESISYQRKYFKNYKHFKMIGELSTLEVLKIRNIFYPKSFNWIGNLKKLRTLDMYNNNIALSSKSLKKLSSLRKLTINLKNKLRSFVKDNKNRIYFLFVPQSDLKTFQKKHSKFLNKNKIIYSIPVITKKEFSFKHLYEYFHIPFKFLPANQDIIELKATDVNDLNLIKISKMKNLEILEIRTNRIKIKNIGKLKKLKKLKSLTLQLNVKTLKNIKYTGKLISKQLLKLFSTKPLSKLKYLKLEAPYPLNLEFISHLKKLIELILVQIKIGDQLKYLKNLPRLKKLTIISTNLFEDNSLRNLKQLTNFKFQHGKKNNYKFLNNLNSLTHLDVSFTHFDCKNMQNIDGQNLVSFKAEATKISEKCLKKLSTFRNLQTLNVAGTRISNKLYKYILKLHKLKFLNSRCISLKKGDISPADCKPLLEYHRLAPSVRVENRCCPMIWAE